MLKSLNPGLIHLDISGNYVTPQLIPDVFASITKFSKLEALNPSKLNIVPKQVPDLFELLSLPSIKSIDLSDNLIGLDFVHLIHD